MRFIRDIVAVEFMELARRMNPMWVIKFEDIQMLTARP